MDAKARAFLEQTHAAAMITLRPDGTPHAVRVGIALLDGRLMSSGTQDRLRTKHLRRDPRATLFVFDPKHPESAYHFLTLETVVTILDGPDAPELNLRLFKLMQGIEPGSDRKLSWFGKQLDDAEMQAQMVAEKRLVYVFDVRRSYGLL